jgi:hypothetical protein
VADAIIASAIANRPSLSVLLIGPPQAMPGTPVYFFIQSSRAGRLRNALAFWSGAQFDVRRRSTRE